MHVLGSQAAPATQAARQAICTAALLPRPLPTALWQTHTTLVVTTFERPACIARFLTSARAVYPSLPVVICDASAVPLFADGTRLGPCMRWIVLDKARGHSVGAARNRALADVATPLFFLCDDDHVLGDYTRLDTMVGALRAHDLDIVGGCQNKDDFGTAVFRLRGRRLEQRFFWHHGRIAPGLVRCDRVSNTFVARTQRVLNVGWEERVLGDEHAEFFWRAKLAGLRVAQLGHCYVDHARDSESPSVWWSRLLRPFLDHADRRYLARRMGGRRRVARAAYVRHCLRKNDLSAIVSRASWWDKLGFLGLMRRR